MYFSLKEAATDSWSWFSGNVSHALEMDYKLTSQTDEADCQTNYLETSKDAGGLVFARFPSMQAARYIRFHINDSYPTTVREFEPETRRNDYPSFIKSLYWGTL
jgi:hypothetical protein